MSQNYSANAIRLQSLICSESRVVTCHCQASAVISASFIHHAKTGFDFQNFETPCKFGKDPDLFIFSGFDFFSHVPFWGFKADVPCGVIPPSGRYAAPSLLTRTHSYSPLSACTHNADARTVLSFSPATHLYVQYSTLICHAPASCHTASLSAQRSAPAMPPTSSSDRFTTPNHAPNSH